MIEFTNEIIFLLILIGASTGLLAGLFGVGGGIVFGPVILFMFKGWNISDNIIFPLTFGTSLFIIIFTSLSAVIKYQSMKHIIWRAVLTISAFSIIGAELGALTTAYTPGWILQRLYGLLLLIVAWIIMKEYTSGENNEQIFKLKYLSISGLAIGVISSMFGIGGGIIGVTIMLLILKLPIKKVAATSQGIILFTSCAGVLGYILTGLKNPTLPEGSIGFVNIKIAVPFIIGTVACAPIGAYLNNKINGVMLKKIFAVFIAVIAVKLILF